VSGFPRFDSDDTPELTLRDIRRRWAKFHASIHTASGNVLQRVLGRMLGEDTVRYKVARVLGRPLLQIVRSFRGTRRVKDERPKVRPDYFPFNYRPGLVELVDVSDVSSSTPETVVVFALDETVDSSVTMIETLNATINRSDAIWLLLVDHSTTEIERRTTAHALLRAAGADDDVVFADEAGPDPARPILKSAAVGPHTLLSYNCVGRPALLSVAVLRALGGFDAEAGWAFEHDAYLRLKESGGRFHHVPAVLPCGRPDVAFEQSHTSAGAQRAVERAFARRGWHGTVSPGDFGPSVQWRIDTPTPAPSIDIIIPTRDRVDLMRQCIDAIETRTTYSNYDIVILDNDSKDPATLDFFATTRYRVVPCPGPFNYAHIVNRGVNHSNAEYIVTLNNDTVLQTPDWLEQMVSIASLDDVSIVGACLKDQFGHGEHESIVISPYPQHLRTDSNYPHADEFSVATRDVAAVTGAVQMVRRELWQSLGGMDEHLKVTMNDVDICLRSQTDGRHVVYVPGVQLVHHVSSSRGTLDPLDDRNRFIQRWDIFGTFKDPYFPESLILLGETMCYRNLWD
jgi:GT2 family glycosyltransferase